MQAYKKKDPESDEEFELMGNEFDALCACLQSAACRDRFLELEGIDLMILLLRNKLFSRFGALKASPPPKNKKGKERKKERKTPDIEMNSQAATGSNDSH